MFVGLLAGLSSPGLWPNNNDAGDGDGRGDPDPDDASGGASRTRGGPVIRG